MLVLSEIGAGQDTWNEDIDTWARGGVSQATMNAFLQAVQNGGNTSAAESYNKSNARSVGWVGKIYGSTNHYPFSLKVDVVNRPKSASLFYDEKNNPRAFALAVKDWQSKNGLSADGKLGPATWSKMQQVFFGTTPKPVATTPKTVVVKEEEKLIPKSDDPLVPPWYKRIPWYGWAGMGLIVVGGGLIVARKKLGLGDLEDLGGSGPDHPAARRQQEVMKQCAPRCRGTGRYRECMSSCLKGGR